MVDKDFSDYDIKLAEWRGSTVQTLIDMNEELKELNIKVGKIDEMLTNMRIKIAGIGAVSGLIVSIVMYIITH